MKIEYVNKRPTYAKAVVSVVDHVECRCQAAPRLPMSKKKSSRKHHSHQHRNQTLGQGREHPQVCSLFYRTHCQLLCDCIKCSKLWKLVPKFVSYVQAWKLIQIHKWNLDLSHNQKSINGLPNQKAWTIENKQNLTKKRETAHSMHGWVVSLGRHFERRSSESVWWINQSICIRDDFIPCIFIYSS